jgi:hypothetical protein
MAVRRGRRGALAVGGIMSYIGEMDKNTAPSNLVVRDSKTGKFVTVRGAGALTNSRFAVRKDVDLTKPIAPQVSRTAGNRKSAKG